MITRLKVPLSQKKEVNAAYPTAVALARQWDPVTTWTWAFPTLTRSTVWDASTSSQRFSSRLPLSAIPWPVSYSSPRLYSLYFSRELVFIPCQPVYRELMLDHNTRFLLQMSNERRSSHGSAECSCGGSEVCPLAAIDDCAFDYRCACFDYKNDFWRSNVFFCPNLQKFIRRVLKNNDRNSSEECSSPSPPCLSQRCRSDRRVQGHFDYTTRCCKSKVANRNLRGSCNNTSSEDLCSSSESLSSSPRKVAPALVALSVSASISPSAQRQHRLPFQRRSPRDERIGSPA